MCRIIFGADGGATCKHQFFSIFCNLIFCRLCSLFENLFEECRKHQEERNSGL